FGGSADRNLVACNIVTPCYVPGVELLIPLQPLCSIAKTLISLGLRSDVFVANDRFAAARARRECAARKVRRTRSATTEEIIRRQCATIRINRKPLRDFT